jgi:hypothetical protein
MIKVVSFHPYLGDILPFTRYRTQGKAVQPRQTYYRHIWPQKPVLDCRYARVRRLQRPKVVLGKHVAIFFLMSAQISVAEFCGSIRHLRHEKTSSMNTK